MTKILFISPARKSRDIMTARAMQEARSAGIMISITTATEKEGLARLATEDDFGLILLCPNLRFLLNKEEGAALLNKTPLIVVPSNILGSLDGVGLLRIIDQAIRNL
ncbi:MAG: hypothetical protein FWE21_02155 [Defluviitaleaceae bacterium]|nr:hypothetical protein [Defluviitaleaceae bacterium]